VVHSTAEQEQLRCYHQQGRADDAQPEEDGMMEMFDALWVVADERGWTDNTLLHKLIDVLENVSREQQEQILAAVKEES
jgi:hypothetical protein